MMDKPACFNIINMAVLSPKFEGDDFEGWLLKLEQYFEVEGIAEENKVRMVMMHLEGRALL